MVLVRRVVELDWSFAHRHGNSGHILQRAPCTRLVLAFSSPFFDGLESPIRQHFKQFLVDKFYVLKRQSGRLPGHYGRFFQGPTRLQPRCILMGVVPIFVASLLVDTTSCFGRENTPAARKFTREAGTWLLACKNGSRIKQPQKP